MAEGRIIVVVLSDSFDSLWEDVAGSLKVGVTKVEPCEIIDAHGAVSVVLAAGGAERDATAWLNTSGLSSETPVFVIGADPSRRTAAQVVAAGARDYFSLPDDIEVFHNTIASASERWRAARQREDVARTGRKSDAFVSITGESVALNEALARSERVLPHDDTTLLVIGETGTGKELLARAVHGGGPRGGAPFVAVNCAALPDRLIESELFGHERGAFTDASTPKPGLFELAEGGTLFLDEIGEMPIDLQPKLLRVLQDKQVRRVGGTKWRKVNVRIIAATNEDLTKKMKADGFRQDLYFRLSVITLKLPPLRERGNDVYLIAEAFLKELAGQYGLPVPEITAEVKQALGSYHWPGNVRELKNAIERTLLLSPPGEMDVKELRMDGAGDSRPENQLIPFPATLDQITAAAAQATLEIAGGNRSEAARRLDISRQRLRRLLGEGSDEAGEEQ
ncbi:MAG: sigma-54 dependent transcriptional regulator [Gemmatimonadota bacterium]|nr:sigma-54 dependent transcriptional regulator [Gemmatimonadota bacterium]MDH5804220.1 sigma-54 dependent transcriptional regulator [Gemmatimonadota bacterium]